MSDLRPTLAILLALILTGCSPAIFTITSYRGHTALDEASLRGLADLADRGVLSKAQILETLGPPVTVIGQDDGEIFMYRRIARDTSTLFVNPGYVVPPAPSIPLWSDADVSGRDDLLMVFFDERGDVRGASFRKRVGEVSGSRAATLGEEIRGWID